MKEKIVKIVKAVVAQHALENGILKLQNPLPETVLFGKGSMIDSIGLVTIIVEVESKVFEELNIGISLSDEKAMSQANSPFKTIDSLVTYIVKSIND